MSTEKNKKVLSIVLNILGIIVGIFVATSGIIRFIEGGNGINYILASYLIMFGVVLVILELRVFPIFYRMCGFLALWIGRGLFYIFCGTLSYIHNDWTLAFPITCILCGIIWIVMAFLKIPLPDPLLGGHTSSGHNEV